MGIKQTEILFLNFDKKNELKRICEKVPYLKSLYGELNGKKVGGINGVVVNLKGRESLKVAKNVLDLYPSVPQFGVISEELKQFQPVLLKMGFEGVEDSPLDRDKIEKILISVLWGDSGDRAFNNFVKEILAFILHTRSEKAVLKRIVESLLIFFKADRVSIMLFDRNSNMLQIKSAVGIPERVFKLRGKKLGEHISGWAFAHAQPLILQNGLTQYPNLQNVKGNPLIKSSMIIPLDFFNRTYGVINFTRFKGAEFTSIDKDRAMLYCSFIGMMLHQLEELKTIEILKKALNKGSEGIIIVDNDKRVIWMSNGARRILGIDLEDSTGSLLYDILSSVLDRVDIKKITLGSKITNLQVKIGKDRLLMLSSFPVKSDDDKRYGTLITLRDMTEIINLQREQINVGKMHEFTKWVDEIAHQINNPLSVVMGNIRLLEDIIKGCFYKEAQYTRESREKLFAEIMKIIREVAEASEKIEMFIRTLKNYNIDMDIHRERVFLQEIIDRAIDISDIDNVRRVAFVKRYKVNPIIWCVKDRIIAAFVTILKNIIQSSLENEKIYITLSKQKNRLIVEIDSSYKYTHDDGSTEDPLSSFYAAMNIPEGLQKNYGLVSSIINFHGGRVEFELKDDKLKVRIEFSEEV